MDELKTVLYIVCGVIGVAASAMTILQGHLLLGSLVFIGGLSCVLAGYRRRGG